MEFLEHQAVKYIRLSAGYVDEPAADFNGNCSLGVFQGFFCATACAAPLAQKPTEDLEYSDIGLFKRFEWLSLGAPARAQMPASVRNRVS